MSTITVSPSTPTYAARTRSTPGADTRVRLTRRGRLVVFVLALVVVLTIGILLAAGSVATEQAGAPEPTRVVMVGTGETLWDIAAGVADDGDVRAMIERIEELNALDTAMLTAGQRLRVPVA